MMKGKITISRWHSNQDGDGMSIEVWDEVSGVSFLEVEMTPHDFALALTGLARQECTFELRGVQNIGKVREQKTVIIEVTGGVRENEKAALLAPFEVDGWKGYAGDLGNSHHRVGNGYRVSFSRFVDLTPSS
jgi:hypothetical protein